MSPNRPINPDLRKRVSFFLREIEQNLRPGPAQPAAQIKAFATSRAVRTKNDIVMPDSSPISLALQPAPWQPPSLRKPNADYAPCSLGSMPFSVCTPRKPNRRCTPHGEAS